MLFSYHGVYYFSISWLYHDNNTLNSHTYIQAERERWFRGYKKAIRIIDVHKHKWLILKYLARAAAQAKILRGQPRSALTPMQNQLGVYRC